MFMAPGCVFCYYNRKNLCTCTRPIAATSWAAPGVCAVHENMLSGWLSSVSDRWDTSWVWMECIRRAVGWNRLLSVQNKRRLSTGFLDCLWSIKYEQSQRIKHWQGQRWNCEALYKCQKMLLLFDPLLVTAHVCWILISNNHTNINTKQLKSNRDFGTIAGVVAEDNHVSLQ